MIVDITWGTRARVWWDELPPCIFDCDSPFEHSVPAGRQALSKGRLIGVEWVRPSAGPSNYGLLGLSYHPSNTHKARIRIPRLTGEGPVFSSNIAWRLEVVRAGLPEEFIPGIVDGVRCAAQQIAGLPAGEITFCAAAHGETGSSRKVFEFLAMGLIKMLELEDDLVPEDKLKDLFDWDSGWNYRL
ncbi:MAG TPA: hypothetical protein VI756_23900 [Blastocatellia bacterium]